MNKSMLYFIAGILSGSVATVLINSFSSNHEIAYDDSYLNRVTNTIEELNSTTSQLKTLLQKYTVVLPPIETGHKAPVFNKNNLSEYNSDEDYSPSNSQYPDSAQYTNSSPNATRSIAPNQPTLEQIEQYNSIETELYNSANNTSISLSKLINDADQLTPQQRNSLTQKVMEMIKRGELKASQFDSKPSSWLSNIFSIPAPLEIEYCLMLYKYN